MLKLQRTSEEQVYMKVISVGSAANNIVEPFTIKEMEGVEFISVNTDYQTLDQSHSSIEIQSEIGEDVGVVLIIDCMGNETGTRASPTIAKISKEVGILTIGVVTKPFNYEDCKCIHNAEKGIQDLKNNVDTLVVIPNDKLLQMIQEILLLTTMPINPKVILNVKLSEIRTILADKGIAYIGTGRASGENKIKEAVEMATQSQLLDKTIDEARYILMNITIPANLGLNKVSEAIYDLVSSKEEVVYNVTINNDLCDEVIVTVLAAGFQEIKSHRKKSYSIDECEIPVFLKRK